MNNLDFIYNRHSVRKFKDEEISTSDLKEIIKAATHSANGKNLQNWHFVAIKNKEKINELADIVEKEHYTLLNKIQSDDLKESFSKYLKFQTIFKHAPVVILVFAGPYPTTGLDVLEDIGASNAEIEALKRPNSGIQSVGAAVENLLLAASNMGYGGCWMTSANFASNAIENFAKPDKDGYYLATLVTLGVPFYDTHKSPKRKALEDVLTIIE